MLALATICHSAVILLTAFFLVMALRIKGTARSSSVLALIGFLATSLSWTILELLLYVRVVALSQNPTHLGSSAGLLGMLTAFAFYLLCELLSPYCSGKTRTLRVAIVAGLSLLIMPLFFTSHFIYLYLNSESIYLHRYGPLYYLTSSWSAAVVFFGLLILWRRSRVEADDRRRYQIRTYILVGFLSALIAIFFKVFLPALGSDSFHFLGSNTVVFPAVILSYSCIFHRLLDIKSLLLRITSYLLTFLIFGMMVFGVVVLFFPRTMPDPLSFVCFGLGASLVGYTYFRFLQPRIDNLFFTGPEVTGERILCQRLAATKNDVEPVLDSILQSLNHCFGLDRAVVVTADRRNRVAIKCHGERPEVMGNQPRARDLLVRCQLRLPSVFVAELSRVLMLEEGDLSLPFRSQPQAFQRYPRVVRSIHELISSYRENGYRVLVPLLFGDELWGYLVLGRKSNRLPFFTKEIELLERIRLTVTLAIRNQVLYQEMNALRNRAQTGVDRLSDHLTLIDPSGEDAMCITLGDRCLVYGSQSMATALGKIERFSENRLPVLIRGETGTGKELMARLIHDRSQAAGPFVPVNCAAIPASLWESMVFGHEKGAFTDAKTDSPGLVAAAGKGTLFFDEIGEMPIDVQPKILRLLQERCYSRIGSPEIITADCRLLFSTHRDLEAMIPNDEFREDLYYRINVLSLVVPPLRDRRSDIPLIVRHILRKYSSDLNRDIKHIDAAAMAALVRYSWPGNVRELENCVLRMMSSTRSDRIMLEDLPGHLREDTRSTCRLEHPGSPVPETNVRFGNLDLEQMVKDYSRDLIQHALKEHCGNKTKAAEALGISRGKLKYQIKQLGI